MLPPMIPRLLLLLLVAAPRVAAAEPKQAPMVEVAAGPFLMGSVKADKDALKRERPQRRIELSGFWIDAREVKNAHYEACVAAKACKGARQVGGTTARYYAGTRKPEQPVVGVTLRDAKAYCAWVGRRLPTEPEWEKAARGGDGRLYPWGNERPTCERANFTKCGGVAKPVGSHPTGVSPYGALDMAGNAIEWTSTTYKGTALKTMPDKDPPDPKRGGWRTIRGGSWGSYSSQTRSAFRRAWDPRNAGHTVGFRCASSTAPVVP